MSTWQLVILAVLAYWLIESAHAKRSRKTDDPRLAYGPVQHVVKSGDYTDAELETLRPVLAAVPISEWPDIVAECRTQELHAELADDAKVAAWLEGRA